jgi:hypothetical protein
MSETWKTMISIFAMLIFVAGIILLVTPNANQPSQDGDQVIYSRYIPVETYNPRAGTSSLVFDKNTDLVYVILYEKYRLAISPYYIVDESNTQRIAEYPKDLDYLIAKESTP